MPENCACSLCDRNGRILEILKNGSKEDLRKLVDELTNDLYHAEQDADYYKCILDGSWPSSVRQLTQALEKALVHPNRKLDLNV